MPPSAVSPDADVILNRVNLALAKSERLLASWLPPKPSNASNGSSSAVSRDAGQQQQKEEREDEDDLFTAEPELLGLGAKQSPSTTATITANDKLRKRLLGRRNNGPQTHAQHTSPHQSARGNAKSSRNTSRALTDGSHDLSYKRNHGASMEAEENDDQEDSRTTIPRARPLKRLKPDESPRGKKAKKEKEQTVARPTTDAENDTSVQPQASNGNSPPTLSPAMSAPKQMPPSHTPVPPSSSQEHQPNLSATQQHHSPPPPPRSNPLLPVSPAVPVPAAAAKPTTATTETQTPKPDTGSSASSRPSQGMNANQRERRRRKKQRARERKREREHEREQNLQPSPEKKTGKRTE